jgi:glucose/arabinose dehydrogenase
MAAAWQTFVLALASLLISAGQVGAGPFRDGCMAPGPSIVAQLVMGDLQFPVSMAVAPDGRVFFNELKTGRTRIIQGGVLLSEPFSTQKVATDGEQGLLGLALHPTFETDPYVYLYHTYKDRNMMVHNRVIALRDEGNVGVSPTVILDHLPASNFHNSGILLFSPDHRLFVSTGDAEEPKKSQDPDALNGKVLRVNPNGSIPLDNPFPGSPVYALGFRNPFGMAFGSSGRLFLTENGPDRNDEVNEVLPAGNYGWPEVTGFSSDPRFVNPLLNFTPPIAPTGIAFYQGHDLRRNFMGVPFFGAWNTGEIRSIFLRGCRGPYDHSQVLKTDNGILDVEMATDGYLYFTTPTAIFRVVGPTDPDLRPSSATTGVTAVALSALAVGLATSARRRRRGTGPS